MFLILWVFDAHIGEIVNHEYRKEQKNTVNEDESMFYCSMGHNTVYQLRFTKKTLAWLEKLRIEGNKPDEYGNIKKMRFAVFEARQFQYDIPEDINKVGEAMALSDTKGANFNQKLKQYCLENNLDYESELMSWTQII